MITIVNLRLLNRLPVGIIQNVASVCVVGSQILGGGEIKTDALFVAS